MVAELENVEHDSNNKQSKATQQHHLRRLTFSFFQRKSEVGFEPRTHECTQLTNAHNSRMHNSLGRELPLARVMVKSHLMYSVQDAFGCT